MSPKSDRPGTDPPITSEICHRVVFGMTMRGDRNVSWLGGPGNRTLFNTYLMPNDPMMDCGTFGLGWFKASSGHPGGANMVLGDGSVHFISNDINQSTTWHFTTTTDVKTEFGVWESLMSAGDGNTVPSYAW